MRIRRSATWLFLLAVPVVVRAADEVEYHSEDGKKTTVRGNIREETSREVVVQAAGDPVRIPVYRIEQVRYDQQPPELVSARNLERQGKLAEAIEAYTEIGKSLPEGKDRLREAVAFGVFRCAAGLATADPAQAETAIQWHAKHGDAFRETRHYYPMQELLGQVQLAKGDFDAAAKAFAPLRDVDWPGYKEKGTLYQGVTLLRQQKPQEAIPLFDEVMAKRGDEAKLENARWLAAVYKAEALTQTGKPADAEKLLRESLDKAPVDMTDVQSIGRNALGDALLAEKKSPKEAMLDGYMWVLVVYNNHPDQLAKALYHLQAIFQQIGQPERAEQMAARLKSEFSTSEWTKKLAGS